tara:strand:+ start:290 stop:472 length:183 start_codon:yes stop_codon:yes gene_type:complete
VPKYLVTGTIYGQFEKVLDCSNERDALLEANEMAPWYTDVEVDIVEYDPDWDEDEEEEVA